MNIFRQAYLPKLLSWRSHIPSISERRFLSRPVPVIEHDEASFRGFGRDNIRSALGYIILCLALLLTTIEANATPYTSFNNDTYELTPWEGTNIVVLTGTRDLDSSTMSHIVEKLDDAWAVYEDLTGRLPTPIAATRVNGRTTIAEVPDGATCGAGCAYLGFTGIEIASTYWDVLYNGVNQNNLFDQVLFYELGRNFWLYGDQLNAIDTFVTGFAIANRFVSMTEIDVAAGPFGDLPFDEFQRLATSDLIVAYFANSELDWRNTLGSNSGVPGQRFDGPADLAGAMMHRVYEDHGFAAYRSLWREMNDLPLATTIDEAMVNFINAAYLGTGQDYRLLFKATDLPAPAPHAGLIPIDIRPADIDNLVDPHAEEHIRVAVLSDIETSFDPLQLDILTLRFGPDGANVVGYEVIEINGDRIPDLLLRFNIRATGIECGDSVAILSGETYDGQSITSSDSIETVGCESNTLRTPEPIADGLHLRWESVDAVTINVHTGAGAYLESLPGDATEWLAPSAGDYFLVAADRGDWRNWKRSVTVSVDEHADSTSVGNLRVSIYDTHSAEVFWDPPHPSALFAVAHQVYRDDVLVKTCDCRSHYDADLTTDTDYRYTVVPLGASGVSGREASIVVRISTPESVGAPENLRGTVYSSSALELFWDRNTRVRRYEISRDGIPIASTDGVSFFNRGLRSGQVYRYAVKAYGADDVEGNTSYISLRTQD